MKVTIHDVARHAGVSAMTVSRVINEKPRVSVDTRKRVQASIAELGYVPNRLARGLIQRKTGAFGVIVPDVACDATRRLLALSDAPTAIFAVNNIAVVGVVEAARQQNLEIPRDLALVCFDDIEHVSRLYPFLTVMAQPAETFGTIATQLLIDRLAGRVGQRRRIVVLPADFIVRKSSGALAPEPAEAS